MRPLLALLIGCLLWAGDPPAPPVEQLKEQALLYAQSQADSAGGTFIFRVVQPPTLPVLKQGKLSFQPSHVSKKDMMGRFFVAFRLFLDGNPVGICRVDLEGRWSGKLVRTTTALSRKAIPDATTVEEYAFEGCPPPGAITAIPEGYRLRVPVGAGRTLTRMDLEAIPIINAGDPVRVELNWGPLTITSDAIARSFGPKGERIRLELLGSHRMINAVITAPGEAQAEWNGGR